MKSTYGFPAGFPGQLRNKPDAARILIEGRIVETKRLLRHVRECHGSHHDLELRGSTRAVGSP